MIGGDAPSPLDVRFRLFGFPIRVSPYFWLISAMFGGNLALDLGLPYLAMWVGCSFFSILLHELGHAFAYRLFGSRAQIVLHGFGGYALGQELSAPWKRMLVALAGPGIQLGFAGALYASSIINPWMKAHPALTILLYFLLLMNVVWALLQLVPILPFDGGLVLREVLHYLRVRNPAAAAHLISVGVAGLLAVRGVAQLLHMRIPIVDDYLSAWLVPSPILTFWLILLAFDNFQSYQRYRQYRPERYAIQDDDVPPWRRR